MVILHLDADGDGEFELIAEAPLIYLDHWALRLFASEPGRRARFREAFRTRGTLMISVMNADEIARTTLDETAGELRSLMDGIGPRWLPMTVDPMRIIDAEMGNTTGNNPCASQAFLLAPKFADVDVPVSAEGLRQGRDNQLETAIAAVEAMPRS